MHSAGDADNLIALHDITLIAAQQAGVEHHAKTQLVGIAVNHEEAHRFAIVRHPDETMQFTVTKLFNRQAHHAIAPQRYGHGFRELRRLRGHFIPPQLACDNDHRAADCDQPQPQSVATLRQRQTVSNRFFGFPRLAKSPQQRQGQQQRGSRPVIQRRVICDFRHEAQQ